MDIKPIETVYNGYRFRSRLEARWAVFFDAAGIKYQYEPEGFVGIYGKAYLPDFYLSEEKVYVEVKGSNEQLAKDASKILEAIDYHATPIAEGLIILGEIPNYENIGLGNFPMFPYLWHNEECVGIESAIFVKYGDGASVIRRNDSIVSYMFGYSADNLDCAEGAFPSFVSTTPHWTKDWLRSRLSEYGLKDAYRQARQARFEHGECPVPGR